MQLSPRSAAATPVLDQVRGSIQNVFGVAYQYRVKKWRHRFRRQCNRSATEYHRVTDAAFRSIRDENLLRRTHRRNEPIIRSVVAQQETETNRYVSWLDEVFKGLLTE